MHFGRVVPVNAVQLQALIGSCGGSPQTPSPGGAATQSPVVTMNSTLWGYQEPDGAVHEFFDRQYENVPPAKNCWTDARATGEHCFVYTHDGSFVRMDPKDPEYGAGTKPVVYFPDGTRRVMGYRAGRTRQDNTQGPREDLFYADIAPDFAPGNFLPPAFHSTEIADPFGNKIVVQYYGDGTAPAHPLAALGVPQHQWDAIPYRAYADSYPAASYYFDVWVGTYSPIVGGPTVRIPFVSSVRTPTSSTLATSADYYFYAGLQTGPGGPGNVTFPILQSFVIPAGLSYTFTHALSNQPPFLTQVTLPSGGLIQYDYTDIKLATKQPNENCSGAPSDCYVYQWDTVTGVKKRRAVRNVRTSAGGATTPESAETTYFRTYLGHTDPVSQPSCAVYGPASCQMRVDQWAPVGLGSGWNVTRSTFYESDGYTNTALYGRPFQIDEFFPAATTTPSRAAIDAIASTPVKRTTIAYDYDTQGDGHSHNTREFYRKVQWCGGAACGSQRYSQTQRYGWDGYAHFRKTVTSEAADGTNAITLKSAQAWHLNTDDKSTTTRWILEPLTSRTTSTDSSDNPPAAVSSTEAFNVNQNTGFVQNRTVTANDNGDSRVLTTTWAPGTQQSAPCLLDGSPQAYCNNRGFPITETTQLSGSRTFGSVSEPSTTTSFTRSFFYQYGSPSAWYDSGTTFYGLDNDLSVCGKVLSARGSEGRTSLRDVSPHSTTFEYDALGRVTKRTPYGEWPETTTYATQTAITKRCGDQACSSFIGTSKSYFDELGRPTVSLRSMPGANAWSYKVATYDTAGRTVSDSQWQALTCDEADPCSAGTTNLLNLQAAISGSGSTSTVNIPGTIRTSFGLLGIPQYAIQADGSLTTSSPIGWWQVQTTRSVNQPPSNSTYTYNRDALGRLTSVVEPATQASGGACMNNADTTTYTYDAFDRLRQATKVGTDSACATQASQTRTWAYDDFGWLVSEQTPEVPNYEVRQRDGRGNIIVDCTGPTSSCGPAPMDHSTQDRISRCYDPAGRLLSATRAYDLALHPRSEASHCTAQSPAASYEDFFYDGYSYPGVSLNFGRANGRLVYSVRHNLVNSNRDTNFFGWFAIEDLYQYSGVGDRLNQRQLGTFQVGGLPSPLAGRLGLGTSKPAFSTGLADYFTAAKRKIKKHDEGLATAATTAAGATPAPAGRVALDAYNPNGWFRWYWYYDQAGRPYQMLYPRRDESTRTWVQNAFERGWLTAASVNLTDPFNPSSSTAVTANLAYSPSGTQSQVTLFANPGTQVYSLRTPDDGSMGRIGQWLFDRGVPIPGNPYGTGMEYRSYSYDGSGNVTNTTTGAFSYDLRSRLTKFVEYGITQTRTLDSFGNLWRVDDSSSGTQIFTPEMATNRHIATGSGVTAAYDANRGTFVFDSLQSRNVGRELLCRRQANERVRANFRQLHNDVPGRNLAVPR